MKYRFSDGDGNIHEIEGPDNATEAQVMEAGRKALSNGVAKDTAKSALTGLGRAPANILGMPGDVASLFNFILKNEASKYPGPVFPFPSVNLKLPTSSDLQGTLENATGSWYQPQTVPGRYAKAIAEGAASMPINPMSAFTGGLGGFGTELGSELTGGNPLGQLGGGLLFGVVPAGARSIGLRATQRLREATSGLTPDEWDAALMRQRMAQSQGLKVTGAEALNDINLLQQQRILENTPKTSGVMERFFGTRFDDTQNLVNRFLNSITPQASDPLQVGNKVQAAAQAALDRARRGANTLAEPSYNASVNTKYPFGSIGYQEPQIPIELRQDRVYQQAADAVRGTPTFGLKANEPTYSPRTMDAAKKWLNDQISSAKAAGENAKAAQLQKAFNRVTRYADQMYPDYAVARDITSRVRADELVPREQSLTGKLANTEDPIAQFNALINSKTARRNSIERAAVDIRQSDPEAFVQLVRTGLENEFDDASKLLQSGGREFSGARFVRAMRETPQTLENVHAMLGKLPDGNLRIKAFNNALIGLEVTGNRLPTGSATAFNEMQKSEMTSQGLLKLVANPTAPLGVLDRISYNMTAKRLATIFTDPDSVGLIKQIAATKPGTARMDALLAGMLAGQKAIQATR